jgi:transposase
MDTIRQTLLFSFDQLYKMQTKSRLEQILNEITIPVQFSNLFKASDERGPKGYSPLSMFYAIIAMRIEGIPNVSSLVRRLKTDLMFRYVCGFEVLGTTPSDSTFSRFISKLEESGLLGLIFNVEVDQAVDLGLVELESAAVDSTQIDAFEKPVPKSKIIGDGLHPNWGSKRDTNGNQIRWFGWKYHLICDTISGLPIGYHVTPASVHDSKAAEYLMASFAERKIKIRPKYWMFDSGYDAVWLYETVIEKHKATPLIAFNPKGAFAAPEGFDNTLHPVCSGGYKLTYWGKDGDYLKFRCPHATGHVDCSHGMAWCSTSNYGYCLKLNWRKNPRLLNYPLRGSQKWQKLYNKRTAVERLNHLLKNNLGANNLRSAGIEKAKTWLLISMITLYAGTKVIFKKHQLKQVA